MAQTMSLPLVEEVEQTAIQHLNAEAEVIGCPSVKKRISSYFNFAVLILPTITYFAGGGGNVGFRADNPSNGYPGTGK